VMHKLMWINEVIIYILITFINEQTIIIKE